MKIDPKDKLYGRYVMILTTDHIVYRGKVSYLEYANDTDSGENEIGIDYATGITTFKESEIEDIKPCIEQYEVIMLKDGTKGTVVDYAGPDYIVDIGDSPNNWDTIEVRYQDVEI